MPTHKGIKLSVISQWELQIHPEFAHPDSSQFTGRSPNVKNIPELDSDSDSDACDTKVSKADRILGRSSTVAVYIPSVSGARFWLRYGITEAAAASSPWYYFKLFMNGRHITSWGANSTTKPSGQVMRGLFDPSERWNYKDNGTVYKNCGTEARPFFFVKEDAKRSAAEDGGLIEVLVFRARGRRRRVPAPEEFKSQDKWGIVMPTGGLLDIPQDAKFYDWHLKDAKDRPYASFQFHYRSWDNLISLQLIPAEHTRSLLPASPSLLSLNGYPRELQEPPEENDDTEVKIRVDEFQQEAEARDSISSNNSNTPWMTTVFDDSPNYAITNTQSNSLFNLPRTTSSYPLNVPKSKFSKASLDGGGEDEEGSGDDDEPIKPPSSPLRRLRGTLNLNRPLPDIPSRGSSLKHGNHSRTSSSVSNAVSITPSLRSYFSRDGALSPVHVIGVATVVPVIASSFGLSGNPEKNETYSISSEGADVDESSEHSTVPELTSSKRPLGGVFNLPNITIRKRRHSSPTKHLSPIKQSPVLPSETSQLLDEDQDADDEAIDADCEPSPLDNNMTTLSLTESEWMCRTPSPVRNDPTRDRAEHLWSPTVEKHSLDGSVLRKQISNVGVRDSEEIEDRSLVVDSVENTGVRMRSGNWI